MAEKEIESLIKSGYTEDMINQLNDWCPKIGEEEILNKSYTELFQLDNLKKLLEGRKTAAFYRFMVQYLVHYFSHRLVEKYGRNGESIDETTCCQNAFAQIEKATEDAKQKKSRNLRGLTGGICGDLLTYTMQAFDDKGAAFGEGSLEKKRYYATLEFSERESWDKNSLKDILFGAAAPGNADHFLMIAVILEMGIAAAELFLKKVLLRRGFELQKFMELTAYFCLKYGQNNPKEFCGKLKKLYMSISAEDSSEKLYENTEEYFQAAERMEKDSGIIWDGVEFGEPMIAFMKEYVSNSERMDGIPKSRVFACFGDMRSEAATFLQQHAGKKKKMDYSTSVKVTCTKETYYHLEPEEDDGFVPAGRTWICEGLPEAVNPKPIQRTQRKTGLLGQRNYITGTILFEQKIGRALDEKAVLIASNGCQYHLKNKHVLKTATNVDVISVDMTEIMEDTSKEIGYVPKGTLWRLEGCDDLQGTNPDPMELRPASGRTAGFLKIMGDKPVRIPKDTVYRCGDVEVVTMKESVLVPPRRTAKSDLSQKQDLFYPSLYADARKRLALLREEDPEFVKRTAELLPIYAPIMQEKELRSNYLSEYKDESRPMRRSDAITMAFVHSCLVPEKSNEGFEEQRRKSKKKDSTASDSAGARHQRVNERLKECGFQELYYPNPFDLLIGYILHSERPLDMYQILWAMYDEQTSKGKENKD